MKVVANIALAVVVNIIFITQSFSQQIPSVKSHQTISDTQGSFTGTLINQDRMGGAVTRIGDLDNDGIEDIAVGAAEDDDGGSNRGAVWIMFMTDSGHVKSHQKISDTQGGFTGTLDNSDFFGYNIAALGDLDGDGVEDIAVGAYLDDDGGANKGAVWILFLDTDGTVKSHQKISDTAGNFTATIAGNDYLGASVTCLGDIDGDGIADLAISAHGEDDGGTDRGAVWILFLDTDGTVQSYQKISDTDGDFTGTLTNSDNFGTSLTGLGDVDGDGVNDMLVGAMNDDDGGTDRGAVWVLFLNDTGAVKSHQKISDPVLGKNELLTNYDYFGVSSDTIGDLDSNGVVDIIVGAQGDNDGGSNRGAVFIILLDETGAVMNVRKTSDTQGNFSAGLANEDNFGRSCAAIGDLNNDGNLDMVVGAHYADDGGTERGEVHVVFMDSLPVAALKQATVEDYQKISDLSGDFMGVLGNGDIFGYATSAIGDIDRDGIQDLLVTAPQDDDNGANRGAVWVLFMNYDGSVKSHQKISSADGDFTGALSNSDYFGISCATIGDLDADGVEDLAIGAYKDDDGGTDRGAVWILFMNNDGTVSTHQKISDTQGNFTGILGNSDQFGVSIAAIGDLNRDGIMDLAVGANLDDDGGEDHGAIWILLMNTDGTVSAHQKISDTDGGFTLDLSEDDEFGKAIAGIGDLDRDGVLDISVGAPGKSEGYVIQLFMNADGTVKSYQSINGSNLPAGSLDTDDAFGASIAAVGDINNDGINDILVGAINDDDGGTNRGAVWVVNLDEDGNAKTVQKISSTEGDFNGLLEDSDNFGSSISHLGDLNQDGFPDLAVGAWLDDDGGSARGAVWIINLNDPKYSQEFFSKNEDMNWAYTVGYGNGSTMSDETVIYSDLMGRTTQSMNRNLTEGKALVAQTIYDAYGRAAIQTLPAPIDTMCFKSNFITDNSGNPYSYDDFDLPTNVDNPGAVKNTLINTLGHYYSDNGEEYVATSSYPYIRTEFDAYPGEATKRSASAGDELRMGKGKESRSFTMYSGGELDSIFGADSSYKVTINQTNRHQTAALNEDIVAIKTVSIDGDGNEVVKYINSSDAVIATCRTGVESSCNVQNAQSWMLYEGTQSVNIHVPHAHKSDATLPLPTFIGGGGPELIDSLDINYSIIDLNTNKKLVLNTDYSLNLTTRVVSFLGGYQSGSDYFAITFSYDQNFIDEMNTNGYTIPNAYVSYKLDYSHWAIKYYDLAGRLRKSVQPEGVDCNNAGSNTVYSSFDYNPLGQTISSESPDEGKTEMVYNSEGLVRFSQNALQRTEDKFAYIYYDKHGRPIETGVSNFQEGGIYFDNYYISNTAPFCSECAGSTSILNDLAGLSGNTNTEQSYSLYDTLGTKDSIPDDYTYFDQYEPNYLGSKPSKTWNAEFATWYSYDRFGKAEHLVQQILDDDFTAENTAIDDQVKTIDYSYDQSGTMIEHTYQKNNDTEKLAHHFSYDADGRLKSVNVFDDNDRVAQGNYEYYLTGLMKRREIGDEIQGIDYTYTINGSIKGINHPSLDKTKDPGEDGVTGSDHEDFEEDLFGMMIDYFDNDYSRTNSDITSSSTTAAKGHYNGLIHGVRWKNALSDEIERSGQSNVQLYASNNEELMYRLTYDDRNNMGTAEFGVYNSSTDAFNSRTDYLVWGGSVKDPIVYDDNGNITTLKRNGYDGTVGLLMDDLDYTYTSNTNKLASIEDYSTSTYTNDFETGGSDNFTYNLNGQLIRSQAEDVNDVYYYNSGKVRKVVFASTGDSSTYYYNERGQKFKSRFTDISTGNSKTTWYLPNTTGTIMAFYEQDEAQSNDIDLTGHPIQGASRLGTFDEATGYTTYELKDHLANVRVSVTDIGTGYQVDSWSDYYPFGSPMPGRNSTGDYRYNYQGQELAENQNWVNFELRMYNPSLGRFTSPDPMGQFYSPYLAMANNPILMVDPDGGYAHPDVWYLLERNAQAKIKEELDFLDALMDQDRVNMNFLMNSTLDSYRDQMTYEIDGMYVNARIGQLMERELGGAGENIIIARNNPESGFVYTFGMFDWTVRAMDGLVASAEWRVSKGGGDKSTLDPRMVARAATASAGKTLGKTNVYMSVTITHHAPDIYITEYNPGIGTAASTASASTVAAVAEQAIAQQDRTTIINPNPEFRTGTLVPKLDPEIAHTAVSFFIGWTGDTYNLWKPMKARAQYATGFNIGLDAYKWYTGEISSYRMLVRYAGVGLITYGLKGKGTNTVVNSWLLFEDWQGQKSERKYIRTQKALSDQIVIPYDGNGIRPLFYILDDYFHPSGKSYGLGKIWSNEVQLLKKAYNNFYEPGGLYWQWNFGN
jgi:RHS repeat-associated protein